MIIIFWLCLGLIVYTYMLYPLLVMIWARLFPQKIKVDKGYFPYVTMVIPAYNEEDNLREKLNNCLELDYPPGKIDFLIGSDGSTDRTADILQESIDNRIKTYLFSERRGKAIVINDLMSRAAGEVIVFSDANTIYRPDAIKKLIQYFNDPLVGGVCGKLQLINPDGNAGGEGEGLYWRFENQIKKAEGAIRSVISANAAIFAIRKELFRPLPTNRAINDDAMITLQIIAQKRIVFYSPDAIGVEYTSSNMESEFERKIRISSLNYHTIPAMLKLLSPKYGFTAVAIFSHKLMRWSVPWLAIGMLVSNLLIVRTSEVYAVTLGLQLIVYLLSFSGYLCDRLFDRAGPLIPFYYLGMINLAILVGLWRSLTGTQSSTWKRVQH